MLATMLNMIPLIVKLLCMLQLVNVNALTPEFLVHPVSINATDGTTVKFTCTANNSPEVLAFLVNGSGISFGDERKGFMEQVIDDLGDGIRRKRLLVKASVPYNSNSQIRCDAVGNSLIVSSNTATLLVQGSLSPVVDLSYSFIDASTVNISWSPPFTLAGTDITGYNISVTSNGTATNDFTSDSYYVLLLTDITDSPFDEIIITVSGYNGLDGEDESLTGIYLPSATVDSPVPMSITINRDLTISVMFDISDLYVNQYPEKAFFSLYTNGRLTTDSPQIMLHNFTVHNILRISLDTVYTLVASLSNLAGTFDINSTSIFNTFSIESVVITNTTDGRVCVECVFASFSTDSGYTVELVSNNTVLQYTEIFNRSSDSTVASGCISDVIPGVYTVNILNGRGKAVDISLLPTNVTVTNYVVITPTHTTSNINAPTTRMTTRLSKTPDPFPSSIPTVDVNNDVIIDVVNAVAISAVVLVVCCVIFTVVITCIVWKRGKTLKSYDAEQLSPNDSFNSISDLEHIEPYINRIAAEQHCNKVICSLENIPSSFPMQVATD